tara:strand:+ start:1817 stop:2059 length:243 start_codon:yes stop_codon:yes gene_type:complete
MHGDKIDDYQEEIRILTRMLVDTCSGFEPEELDRKLSTETVEWWKIYQEDKAERNRRLREKVLNTLTPDEKNVLDIIIKT